MKASIIVPTYNRSDQLFRTLMSLVNLDFDNKAFEVIVVDNGSTDKTKEVVFDFIKANPSYSIRYFYDDIPGLLTGRHRGARESKSEILVFIDDDVHADKGWLTAICNSFDNNANVHLVGGKCLPLYEAEPPKWINYFWNYFPDGSKMLVDLSLCDYGEIEKLVSPLWIWGLNFSIRKKTLYECGGFHPDSIPKKWQQFQGDGETGLSIKVQEMGYKAMYNPKAIVLHEVPTERMSFTYFDKRKFYQGVCNSYTEIRLNKGVFDSKINYIFTKILKPAAGKIIRLFTKKSNTINYSKLTQQEELEKEALVLRFKKMEDAGYHFHQKAAKESRVVLEWILKENYFDYKLPEQK